MRHAPRRVLHRIHRHAQPMLDAVRIGHPHFFDAMLFAAEEFGERTLALLVKHRRGVALEGERLAEPLLAFPRHRDDQPFRAAIELEEAVVAQRVQPQALLEVERGLRVASRAQPENYQHEQNHDQARCRRHRERDGRIRMHELAQINRPLAQYVAVDDRLALDLGERPYRAIHDAQQRRVVRTHHPQAHAARLVRLGRNAHVAKFRRVQEILRHVLVHVRVIRLALEHRAQTRGN